MTKRNETNMKLPANAVAACQKFSEPGMTSGLKAQILEHLQAIPENTARAALEQLVANGGPEARLVSAILGKAIPETKDALQNKAAAILNSK